MTLTRRPGPRSPAGMEQWIGRHLAIDQYFAAQLGEGVFVVSPVVASQENMVSGEEPDLRDQFPMEPAVLHPVS